MIVLSKAETRSGRQELRAREGSEDIIGRRPVGGREGRMPVMPQTALLRPELSLAPPKLVPASGWIEHKRQRDTPFPAATPSRG